MPAPVVVNEVSTAAGLVARGVNVVLVIDPGWGEVVLPADGPGRLAVLVGSPENPEVRRAAQAMGAELFAGGNR